MGVVLVVVYNRLSKIETIAILATKVHYTLVAVIINFWVVVGINSHRVLLLEDPEDAILKEIIIRFQMMGD